MDYSTRMSLGSSVSFVLCPIDDYSGEPADVNSYKIHMPDIFKEPLFKKEGYVVFCGVLPSEYHVEIRSDIYHNEKINVLVPQDASEPEIHYISLKPRPSYTFKPGATLLRLSAADEENNPVSDAQINCSIISADCIRGKIAKVPVKAGEEQIYISSVTGRISTGDQFVTGTDQNKEVFTIKEQLDGLRHFKVAAPFKHDHDRGNPIMSAITTKTDSRGEAVIYFRSVPVNKFSVKIEISNKNKIIVKEIDLVEGKTTYLRNIRF